MSFEFENFTKIASANMEKDSLVLGTLSKSFKNVLIYWGNYMGAVISPGHP